MKETEKTKALRALIIRRAGQNRDCSMQPSTRASVVYATKGGV